MQFLVFLDGELLGQVELADDLAVDRLLLKLPGVTLKTPGRALDEGWR